MATGTTTTSQFAVTPQVLLEAVREGMQGLQVLGGIGAITINSSLPEGKYAGETVTVPYLAHLGEWADYSENAEIDITQLSDSAETSSVVRGGKAFTVTDMARILRGYASPMEAGRQMIQDGLGMYVEKKAITALLALGTSIPAIVTDVHSSSSPRFFDRDVAIRARSVFGDETRGIVGTVAHSQVVNRMLTLKDADGMPLLDLLDQNDDLGVYNFKGLGRVYVSDLMNVAYTVTSSGTTPPVLTVSGSPKGMYDQIRIECTTLGAFGTAVIKISLDGGVTFPLTGVTVPVSGIVDRSSDLGLTFTFASGTFATNNVYTMWGKASTLILKRGAAVYWHNNFGSIESMRDVRRKNEVVAADILGVCHAYKKLNGGTRPGVAIAKHNI
jgi:hypothetical protein